jgi:hypothetical protein
VSGEETRHGTGMGCLVRTPATAESDVWIWEKEILHDFDFHFFLDEKVEQKINPPRRTT